MAEAPALSVVVPAYGARATIERCLDGLLRESAALSLEVIVVDSGHDGTKALVRERFPDVRLVALGERAMPGKARNVGVTVARAPVVAFVDADCVVEPGWGERAAVAIERRLPFVGGAVLPSRPFELLGLAGHLSEFAELLPGAARGASAAASCNLVMERALFEAAGGFPEDMRSGEDLVLVARCREALGTRELPFDHARVVRHEQHRSWSRLLSHLVDVGRGAAEARERVPSLPGATTSGRPWLAPAVIAWRLARIFVHARRAQPPLVWPVVVVVLAPAITLSLGAWALGFSRPRRRS